MVPVQPSCPYRFLDPYHVEDTPHFFGRDREISQLLEAVRQHAILTIFGAVGVGKTSLIQAGVMARLETEGWQVCSLRVRNDPLPTVESLYPPDPSDVDLPTFIRRLDPNRPILLVFDQFERFFSEVEHKAQERFARSLTHTLRQNSQIHVVFILRDETLHLLDRLTAWIPDPLAQRFRVPPLDNEGARQAMIKPAEQQRKTWEPALVDAVLEDLADEHGFIAPPKLQVVCCMLWRRAGSAPTLTLEQYQQLGRARVIVAQYLDDLLADLKDEEEQDLARHILKEMITMEDATRAWSLREALWEELVRRAHGNERRAERLIRFWQDRGVVRPTSEGKYRLTHPFLVRRISEWAADDEWIVREARSLLREALLAYWREGRLLEKAELGRIRQHADRLRLSNEEMALILRSALAQGYLWGFWVRRAVGSGVSIAEIVLEALHSEDFRSRANAVEALRHEAPAGLDVVTLLASVLNDPYPNVRGMARQALAQIDTPEARRALRQNPPPDMVLIPAGPFLMGSEEYPDESPMHEVYLDAYYIDRYPVTNAEYKKFIDATGYPPPPHWEGGTYPPGKENHPVSHVCWFDARDYAAWAGKRLPTEAEWEKAARGTDGRRYPWGNTFNSDCCNTDESDIGDTTPVDAYSPQGDSPYGVADMSGNVWEWVADWYDREYYRYAPNRNPKGPERGKTKVLRGGAWDFGANEARCSARGHEHPGPRFGLIGFRCALDVLPAELEPDEE